MTKQFLFSLVAAVTLMSATIARADGIIRPAFSYSIDKDHSSSTTTVTRQMIDLAAGYLTTDGWAILGMYSMESKKTETDSSSSNLDRTSYGAGGGWYSKQPNGPYVDAIYYISSKLTSGSSKYEGTGMQLDLGYKFQISGAVSFGAQLSYRTFDYTKVNGAALSPTYTKTNLDPMLALVIVF